MKVLIAAGGTAGHLNPGLALARELVRRGDSVEFVGRSKGFESDCVREEGFPFTGLSVSGRARGSLTTNIKAVLLAGAATARAVTILLRSRPDVVVGMGAYVSLPVTTAARLLRIPVVIHEQNAVLGLSNRVASRFASAIAVSFQQTLESAGSRSVMTGNPVRFEQPGSRDEGISAFGLERDRPTLLVFGGSQGARSINDAVTAAYPLWRDVRIQVLHLTGRDRFDEVMASLDDTRQPEDVILWHALPSTDRMDLAYSCSDLALCRAGASTLAELAACRLPAIFVPLPGALDQDQAHNAHAAVAEGAAMLVRDDELATVIGGLIPDLLEDRERLTVMRDAMGSLHRPGAASRLADVVHKAAR